MNLLFQLLYLCGYRCARLFWRFTTPRNSGALVEVSFGGRILLIRNSYRAEWTFPGGGIDRGEAPSAAASREILEELGWEVSEHDLEPAGTIELFWHDRYDHVEFFDLRIDEQPVIAIDQREVIEARFFAPEEALRLSLTPHVQHKLRQSSTNR